MELEELLKVHLYCFGFLNIFILSAVPIIFGYEFPWLTRNVPTEITMGNIHATMGIIMVLAAEKHKKPLHVC